MDDAATEMTLARASLPTTTIPRADDDKKLEDSTASTADYEDSPLVIALDPKEALVFEILTETIAAFVRSAIDLPAWQTDPSQRPETVQVCVAGGWVRDKIARHYGGGYDIDLAVAGMTGVQWATLVQQYVQSFRPDVPQSRLGVIAANPDQSKHLETATFTLGGLDLDVSNLRAHEIYADDSRIPIVRLGTPLEDAYRRDFTVNALFYNLQTKTVEDWTGRGVRDLLQTKRLVTPLEPVQTFRDDPLRMLRAIRFAVRLRLTLDDQLREACCVPTIREALRVKVSRERFGKELEGMLSGKEARPLEALRLTIDLGLATIVFGLPQAGAGKISTVEGSLLGEETYQAGDQAQADRVWQESDALLSLAPPLLERYQLVCRSTQHSYDRRLLPLAISLAPYRGLRYMEKSKTHTVVHYIVRESIKFKLKDVSALALMCSHVDAMQQLLTHEQNHHSTTKVTRLAAGLLLRTVQEHWPTTLVLAVILKTRQSQETTDGIDWMAVAEQLYRRIVVDYKLDQCWRTKPLLDGKALLKVLELPRGPVVGLYMQEQIRWMLAHSDGTADDCLVHLRSYQPELPTDEPQPKRPHLGNT
jgi:tRNA nucleotidyltransferase (CCA-adding enzyme)